jgi:hypothetical protein
VRSADDTSTQPLKTPQISNRNADGSVAIDGVRWVWLGEGK